MKYTIVLFIFTFITSYGQRSDFKTISFVKADSIAHSHKGENLNSLPILTQKLTCNLSTDVEKFRAIYTWVCTNIKNDYSSYVKTKKKRRKLQNDRKALLEWNTTFTPKVFKNLLEHKKTACTGYAYLIKELANLADLECKIINGFGRTVSLNLEEKSFPNHSWNSIKLNNKWYFCDATWSAGKVMIEEGKPMFKPEYFEGYFLADPTIFIKNHYPLDKQWTLLDHTTSYTDFISGPIVYKEAFCNVVLLEYPKNMRVNIQKNIPMDFKVSQSKKFTAEQISLVLVKGNYRETVVPKAIFENKKCNLTYTFIKTGNYDVHLKVDDTIIASYIITVEKDK